MKIPELTTAFQDHWRKWQEAVSHLTPAQREELQKKIQDATDRWWNEDVKSNKDEE